MEIMKLSDESLGYGLGVFETMRVENGKVVWLHQHLERMRDSARRIGIKGLERLDNLKLEEEITQAEQQLGERFVLKLLLTNQQIYTPSLSCGLLPGIMRAFVIENRSVVEVQASLEQLLNADEVFLTNSVMEIMGVSQIDRKKYVSMDTAKEIQAALKITMGFSIDRRGFMGYSDSRKMNEGKSG